MRGVNAAFHGAEPMEARVLSCTRWAGAFRTVGTRIPRSLSFGSIEHLARIIMSSRWIRRRIPPIPAVPLSSTGAAGLWGWFRVPVAAWGLWRGYPTCDVCSIATMYPIGYLGIDPASSVRRPRAWASGLPGPGPLWAARYNVAKEKWISETHEIWND